MRYLYFTTFVFLFFTRSYSQNYIDFQKNITRAEITILDSNYTEASNIYYDLFQNYNFVFLGNCVSACQSAIAINNDTLAFYFANRAIKHGLKMNQIETEKTLKLLQTKPQWNSFSTNYDSLRTIYTKSVNWELRKKINELHDRDQLWRDRHELQWWNLLWKPLIKRRWYKELEQIVEIELVPLIKQYGYPGEKLIGIDEKYMHHKFRDEHYDSFMVSLILIHYYSKNRSLDDAFLIEEIKKGNLNAKQFADFHDFRAAYSSDDSPAKNEFYAQWCNNLKFSKTEIEEINKRRAKIGLGTHEQRMREQKNFIESRKQRNNPKPFVEIIY
jgi:hypothetical protein